MSQGHWGQRLWTGRRGGYWFPFYTRMLERRISADLVWSLDPGTRTESLEKRRGYRGLVELKQEPCPQVKQDFRGFPGSVSLSGSRRLVFVSDPVCSRVEEKV